MTRPAVTRPRAARTWCLTLAAAAAGGWAPPVAGGPTGTRAPAPRGGTSGAAVGAPAGGELRARGPDGVWRTWWRAADAPARWPAARPGLAGLVTWRPAAPGVEVGELALSGAGEAWRVRAVLVRLDPARQRLALDANVDAAGRVRAWSAQEALGRGAPDGASGGAAVALNAGMFGDDGPWGWVVHGGRELRAPGAGALASALVVGADGRVRVAEADSLPAVRASARRGEVAEAVQGYPTLLAGDGTVPVALRAGVGGRGVDLAHRDARLAVGELRDGRVLVALTRFDALRAVTGGLTGDLLGPVPLGLTVPEAAALMGALGCRRAVLLDGGLSAQLAVRGPGATPRVWGGLRRVPLGLVARPRANPAAAP